MSAETDRDASVIDDLYRVLLARRDDDADTSYTASLLRQGRVHVAGKVREEALEVVAAALNETRAHVIRESADLVYHLMVLWVEQGIAPDEVRAELRRRFDRSGLEEKESRNASKTHQMRKNDDL